MVSTLTFILKIFFIGREFERAQAMGAEGE